MVVKSSTVMVASTPLMASVKAAFPFCREMPMLISSSETWKSSWPAEKSSRVKLG